MTLHPKYMEHCETTIDSTPEDVSVKMQVLFDKEQLRDPPIDDMIRAIRTTTRPKERPVWFSLYMLYKKKEHHIHLVSLLNNASTYRQRNPGRYETYWKQKSPRLVCDALRSLFWKLDMPRHQFLGLPILLEASGRLEHESPMKNLIAYYERAFGFERLLETFRARHFPGYCEEDESCVPMMTMVGTIFEKCGVEL